jgi:thiol-disulfide isomerase/thioredoxin
MKKTILYSVIIAAILMFAGIITLQLTSGGANPFSPDPSGSPTVTTGQSDAPKLVFKNYGPAPEFKSIDKWFNSDPLTMANFKGEAVLVNFWTYSCIACIRDVAQLNHWQEAYRDQGLTVISIHTPQYTFERVTESVQNAVQRYGITYPVAQDNSYAMWNGYDNQFWPALYLVDKDGKIVYQHAGGSGYEMTENAIRQVVGSPTGLSLPENPEANLSKPTGQAMQFGVKHPENLASAEKPTGQEQVYTLPETLRRNAFALEGVWKLNDNNADLTQGYGRIVLKFNAAKVQLAAQSIKPVTLKIIVDGAPQPDVTNLQALQNYTLFSADSPGKHTLEIGIPQPGFEAQQFIFN